MKAAGAVLAALAIASSAMAQSVIDGDTIRIGAATFRLWGIDAPEAKQTCANGWQAGQTASRAL
jgi:endonuclease YncB( thermonuclease family)